MLGAVVLTVAGSLTISQAQPLVAGEPEADRLMARMIQAYRSLYTYSMTAAVSVVNDQDTALTEQMQVQLAFDRSAVTWRLKARAGERMQMFACDGQKLLARVFGSLPGRYLALSIPQPSDYRTLVLNVPKMQGLSPVEMIMLLSDDPIMELRRIGGASRAQLAELHFSVAAPDPGDRRAEAGVRVTGWRDQFGQVTFWLDPKTHLVTRTTIHDKSGKLVGSVVRTMLAHDRPIPAELLAFDPGQSKPVESYVDLFGGPVRYLTKGQKAPPFALRTPEGHVLQLLDLKDRIVVLDFWTSYCAPCLRALPAMQQLHDWIQANDKPAAVVAVNVRETPEKVRKVWRKLGLNMPVLMDTDGSTYEAYGLGGMPRYVVVQKGIVIDDAPGSIEKLRRLVEQLLADTAPNGRHTEDSSKPAE